MKPKKVLLTEIIDQLKDLNKNQVATYVQLKDINNNLVKINDAQVSRNKLIEQVVAQDAGNDFPDSEQDDTEEIMKIDEDIKGKKKKASGKALRDKTYKKPDSGIVD